MATTYLQSLSGMTNGSAPLITSDIYVLPASVAQQRFWLLDQLQPGNTSLNMPLALRLEGELNVDALEQTLNEIVFRHEVLRTTFAIENGKPVQVIAPETSLELERLDLSELSESEREERANVLVTDEAHVSFKLTHGPLFKAKLLRLATREYILLLTLHHIICDGWSNGVLVRELGEIYAALSQGRPSPLPELPIQYADFALWQQEWLESEAFDEQLAYWKGQLGSELSALDIPTDFPRNKTRTSYGAIESLLLPRPLTRALKTLSLREDVTPFMIFLAAFNVLLHRYSGQNSIIVGSPTANRIQSETEGLIGAFANTLLLKTDLSGYLSLGETLQQVKEVSLGAFSNQTLPFEKLVERIKPAQSRNRNQLFQVLFIFQTAFMQPVELSDLTITPMRSVSPGSIFDLSLGVVERAEGTRLQMEYNTDLFEGDTIKRMLGQLQSILHVFVTDIRQKISELPVSPLPRSAPGELDVRAPQVTGAISQIAGQESNLGDDVVSILKGIWQDVLHVTSVNVNDDFFEIGGHSLLATKLFDQINKKFGVNLPLATLFEATTIERLSHIIREEKPDERWESLVPINSSGTKTPLFLVHAAGGNVLFYRELAPYLGADQPFYALQAIELDGRRPLETRVEDLAARYVKEIRALQPEGPYFLGGRCFGAYVAFEMAQQLRRSNQKVARLIVFDSSPPKASSLSLKKAQRQESKSIKHYIRRSIHHLWSGQFLQVFIQWLGRRSTSRQLRTWLDDRRVSAGNEELMRVRRLHRAYNRAAKQYVGSAFEGPITLIRSAEFSALSHKDSHLGWEDLALGGFEQFVVPGTHLGMFEQPAVRFVGEQLRSRLEVALDATLGKL